MALRVSMRAVAGWIEDPGPWIAEHTCRHALDGALCHSSPMAMGCSSDAIWMVLIVCQEVGMAKAYIFVGLRWLFGLSNAILASNPGRFLRLRTDATFVEGDSPYRTEYLDVFIESISRGLN